jgi:hypothetical protein
LATVPRSETRLLKRFRSETGFTERSVNAAVKRRYDPIGARAEIGITNDDRKRAITTERQFNEVTSIEFNC